jgi:hypothetical protein
MVSSYERMDLNIYKLSVSFAFFALLSIIPAGFRILDIREHP